MASKPKPRECGSCPFLEVKERTDFHPASPEYWCKMLNEWIGFNDISPEWCLPVIQPQEQSCAAPK